MEITAYICIALSGIILGALGGGGSILTVPILVYMFGLRHTEATMYSLFVVGVSSLFGFLLRLRSHRLDTEALVFFGFASSVAAFLVRGIVVPSMPANINLGFVQISHEQLVMSVFGLVVLLAARRMLISESSAGVEPLQVPRFVRWFLLSLYGFAAGALVGFVGAGGGFLIVPALVFLAHLPMREATSSSLFLIFLNCVFAFLGGRLAHVEVSWHFVGILTVLLMAGVFVGYFVQEKLPNAILKRAFGVLMLLVAIAIFFNEFFLRSIPASS